MAIMIVLPLVTKKVPAALSAIVTVSLVVIFGKTDLAKGYIVPMLVAGIFLMTVGVGLFLLV